MPPTGTCLHARDCCNSAAQLWPHATPNFIFASPSHGNRSNWATLPLNLHPHVPKIPLIKRGFDPATSMRAKPGVTEFNNCNEKRQEFNEGARLLHFAGRCAPPKWPARGSPLKIKAAAMVSSVSDLYEFICRGPLVHKTVASSPQQVADNIDQWLECGSHVCNLLGINEFLLTEAQKARVYHYYVPVYLWCQRQLLQHRAKFEDDAEPIPPLVIGVSAPQGSGKTTLVYTLDHLFNMAGRKTASISIDDFYLTAADQAKLAAENAGNTLLELRGNAGSHDLAFGKNTLKTLCSLVKKGTKAKVPRYDKSAYNGQGDRADPSAWPEIEGPLEVIIFEGWMLGFKPLPGDSAKTIDPQLEAVNRNLESYYDAWEKFIGPWIVINVENVQWVYKWRLQAEIAMREEGKPGMSDEQVADFVSRYMPAYKAYLPTLYSNGPHGSKPEHTLVVKVDEQRNPIG